MASTYKFPVPKYNFDVEFPDGVISFQEVSGLIQENEFLEYRVGSSKLFITEKRAGMAKTSTITFKKGIIKDDTDLKDLYQNFYDRKKFFSDETPPDITVTLNDEEGNAVTIWKVFGVVPIKLDNGDLKSEENAHAIEQMDLAHYGIEIQ